MHGVGASTLASSPRALSLPQTQTATPRFYSDEEYALVTHVCDLIIPRSETPGAVDALVPAYLDALFFEWADTTTQTEEHEFLAAFAQVLTHHKTPFVALPTTAQEQHLNQFDHAAFRPDRTPLQDQYRRFKTRLTQAYFVSEVGATQELNWRATPGRWIPSMPLEASP